MSRPGRVYFTNDHFQGNGFLAGVKSNGNATSVDRMKNPNSGGFSWGGPKFDDERAQRQRFQLNVIHLFRTVIFRAFETSGFHVYVGSRIWPDDQTGVRACFSQQRMICIPVETSADGVAKVIYTSKDGRVKKTWKKASFQPKGDRFSNPGKPRNCQKWHILFIPYCCDIWVSA